MVGRDLTDLVSRSPAATGRPMLEIDRLTVRRPGGGQPLVADASVTVHAGEVVGLFGLLGAGRTELLEAVAGLRAGDTSGRLRLAGEPVAIRSPRQALDAGVVLAPEDRKRDGLVLGMSVAENVSLASLERITRAGFLRPGLEAAEAADAVRRLAIKTPSTATAVGSLSGGNQQKVVLAKGLACGPRVLLLDEPTRGIDIGAKREIYAVIDGLAQQGLAILVASSELPELLGIADRIAVLADGRVTAEFSRDTATEQAVLHAALPADRRAVVSA
jgi:ABC-type sugar transport system ATPase subunit